MKKLTIRATPVVHTGPLSIVGQSCAGSVGAGGGGRSARMQNAQKRVDLRGTSANWSAKISGARFGVRGDQRGAAICHALTVRDEQGPGLIAAEEILVGADEGPAASGSAATDSHRRSLGTAGKCAGRSAAARGVRLWAQFWSHSLPSGGVHRCPRPLVRAGQGRSWTVVNSDAQYSKACEGATLPWVQIPPPPPLTRHDAGPWWQCSACRGSFCLSFWPRNGRCTRSGSGFLRRIVPLGRPACVGLRRVHRGVTRITSCHECYRGQVAWSASPQARR